MSSLVFYYGVVSSAKTANLIATYNAALLRNKHPFAIKPLVDTRSEYIESRLGLQLKPDYILNISESINHILYDKIDFISMLLIDEVQFLTPRHIDELFELSLLNKFDIYCYGLKTTYTNDLWDSSARLLAVADDIIEVPCQCWYCTNKASLSRKADDNESNSTMNPGWNTFIPVCKNHYR